MKNFIAERVDKFQLPCVRLLNRPEIAAGFLQLHLSKIHVNNSIQSMLQAIKALKELLRGSETPSSWKSRRLENYDHGLQSIVKLHY